MPAINFFAVLESQIPLRAIQNVRVEIIFFPRKNFKSVELRKPRFRDFNECSFCLVKNLSCFFIVTMNSCCRFATSRRTVNKNFKNETTAPNTANRKIYLARHLLNFPQKIYGVARFNFVGAEVERTFFFGRCRQRIANNIFATNGKFVPRVIHFEELAEVDAQGRAQNFCFAFGVAGGGF